MALSGAHQVIPGSVRGDRGELAGDGEGARWPRWLVERGQGSLVGWFWRWEDLGSCFGVGGVVAVLAAGGQD